MLRSGLGSNTIHNLSQAWSNESRGARLTSSDFDTKTQIRTGSNPVEAILVQPVAFQAGRNGDQIIAQYPVYAAIAVDSQTLKDFEERGLATQRHTTLSEATREATKLNQASETAYLNDYQSGALTPVQSWQKFTPDQRADTGIAVRAAANQSLSL